MGGNSLFCKIVCIADIYKYNKPTFKKQLYNDYISRSQNRYELFNVFVGFTVVLLEKLYQRLVEVPVHCKYLYKLRNDCTKIREILAMKSTV
jgi:hypothetical protein